MRTHLEAALPSRMLSLAAVLVGRVLRRTPPALAAFLALAPLSVASAQQGIVQNGFAVVTGYSGFVANPPPSGANPADYLTVNTNGFAARVVDLTNPGPQGTLSPAPKPFSVPAAQVGQVFGVALDNAPQPNVYLAATSAYGLSIGTADGSGNLMRLQKGAPGAQFVPGQFGQGGGPNSVWRVDGVSGAVTLLATVGNGAGSVASLGGMAYDPVSQQLFVADRGSGVVYRMGLDGTVKGTFDHGVEGRPGGGLAPLPMPV